MELEKKPINNELSIAKTLAYLLLGIPASMCIGSILARISTLHMSNFEGASGYAAIVIFIISSSISYLISLIFLAIFSKKKPELLSAAINIFGILAFLFLIIVLTI